MASFGIIGAGRIGQAVAQIGLRAGRQVVIANSRRPESLTATVEAPVQITAMRAVNA
jgi:hypothetical protein